MPNIMAQIAIDNGEDPDLNNGALPEMEKQLLEKLASTRSGCERADGEF